MKKEYFITFTYTDGFSGSFYVKKHQLKKNIKLLLKVDDIIHLSYTKLNTRTGHRIEHTLF